MAHKPVRKMPVSERAKQFMSFSAVSGLAEAIAEAEYRILHARQPDMSEEELYTLWIEETEKQQYLSL